MDSTTPRYLDRVRYKLNWLLFLHCCGTYALWVPLLVAGPTVVVQLLLRRPFPVGIALSVGGVTLVAWAAWHTWRSRFDAADVSALADSWMGGTGAVLMGSATSRGPVPGTRWRWVATRSGIVACATLFVWHVPILAPVLPPALVTHSTRQLEDKLEELDRLALLPAVKKEELTAALEELTAATEEMSSEEFWHANDAITEKLDQALAESQSTFEQAAGALQNLAAARGADLKALARALPQLLQNMPDAVAGNLAELARAGRLEELAEALKQLPAAEIDQLGRQLEQQASRCQGQRAGNGDGIEGLAAALERQMAEQPFTDDAEGNGRGGVSRGPGTNNRLFGDESPQLQAAMNNALLPAVKGTDPGEWVQGSEQSAAPRPGRERWGQPASKAGTATGEEDTSAEAPVVAPRYRAALGRYFTK